MFGNAFPAWWEPAEFGFLFFPFPFSLVWRRQKPLLLQLSYRATYRKKLIHIAASAGKMGLIGVLAVVEKPLEMMQSFAWDSFNHSLGFGSLVRGARQANRSISLPFPQCTQARDKSDPNLNQCPCQAIFHGCMSIEIMSATCSQSTQRHPTRFNTRTSQ